VTTVSPHRYARLTPALAERFAGIVGADHLFSDSETLAQYARDETEDYFFRPDLVLKPATTGEVPAILALACREHIPVTPRGGGTGLSGGALPVHGGICLSMERLSQILEIDAKNLVAVVEPGVITQVFQEEVERLGLFYPPDPASRGSSHLGGNLAECAGGPRAVKYGVTKDYVIGIEAVLPDGRILNTGGRVLKNVSGYNLTQMIIGSEGTLAVITRIILRLVPLPRERKVLLVAFRSLDDAAAAVAEIFQAGITPSALEFMERAAVRAAEERQGKKFPNGNAEAQLFIEVDGMNEEQLRGEVESIAGVVERFKPLDVLLAEDRAKIENVWALRRGIGEAVKSIAPYKEEDTVVPRSKLPELIRGVKEICLRYDVESICYGHAGDGNIHVNILKKNMGDADWPNRIDRAIREILTLTVALGGTISGEHGIGYSQRSYLAIALSPMELALMWQIKALFDPHHILNPGKIFPPE